MKHPIHMDGALAASSRGRFAAAYVAGALGLILLLPACAGDRAQREVQPADTEPTPVEQPWTELCDVSAEPEWQASAFGGQGEVYVEAGRLIIGRGNPLSGITWPLSGALWSGEQARTNYELEVRAARVDGNDFFIGLTFPVADSYCSLILGGWGGALVGLSSLDGLDAARNKTCQYHDFERGRFYTARVRVEPERIRVWLSGELIIDEGLAGRTVGLRPEVEWSRPLGIANFSTTTAIESFSVRRL